MEVNRCFGCMEETLTYPCPHCGYDPEKQKPQDYALRPGTILYGKYLVGSMLGQGGFGITYIGLDLALERKVAIKEYFPSAHVTRHSGAGNRLQWYITEQARIAQSSGREMFLKEARKMNRVASIPQVVQVRDLFQENETAYIIMDFIEGETLMQRLKRTGPLPWNIASKLLLPVIDAMEQVHKEGLIHRDLSPDNLMLQLDGSVKILDLGAAKDLNINSGASSIQVAKGGFSPLEQYIQRGGSGTWTDVYSMAATMYYTLTGVVPPSAIDRMDNDTLRWDLPRLLTLPPHVIRALKKAMALRTNDRTQTMAEFAAGLRVSQENVAPNPVKPKGRGTIIGLAAAAVLAVVILGIGIFTGNRKEPASLNKNTASSLQQQESPTEQETKPSLMKESQMPWGGNVLMEAEIPDEFRYDEEQAPIFGSKIARYQVTAVTFLDSVESAPSDSWDVSVAGDGSVLAWAKRNGSTTSWVGSKDVSSDGYDLFIAAKDGINGKNCANLFEGYQNLTSVSFNDAFHTDYAESMESMFDGCYNLRDLNVRGLNTSQVKNMDSMFWGCIFESLDVSGFDTSNVENMSAMFSYCDKVTSLDLSSFDTSKVTDMADMFHGCFSLKLLNISSFDTRNVTDMSFLFAYCNVENLNLSHFNTSKVKTMAYMFSGDDNLISVDLRGFDTSQVTDMMGMFKKCTSLKAVRGIESLDTSNVTSYEDFMDPDVKINDKPWENLFHS